MGSVSVVRVVDVLIIGGTSAAVAAGISAAEQGASVYLATPLSYLGEDVAGTYRLWGEHCSKSTDELVTMLQSDPQGGSEGFSRPLWVKRTLEQAALSHGVEFLYQTYFIDGLKTDAGDVAGAILANRSGMMAVRAKTIIDGSSTAVVARAFGESFAGIVPAIGEFKRIVIGDGIPQEGRDGVAGVKELHPLTILPSGNDRNPFDEPKEFRAFEYTLDLPLGDYSVQTLTEADQLARDATWSPDWVDASDILFHVPHVSIPGVPRIGDDLEPFTPGIAGLYVLSGMADLHTDEKRAFLDPGNGVERGRHVGLAAANEASTRSITAQPAQTSGVEPELPEGATVRPLPSRRRRLTHESDLVSVDQSRLPLLGIYDVVVAGGGTGGAPAGIGAARTGARTLVLEYLYGLGGVATLGLITRYYHGNRVGFTEEIDRGVLALAGSSLEEEPQGQSAMWDVNHKAEWFRRESRAAGASVWFGSFAAGVVTVRSTVTGVVAATPYGAGLVLCGCSVDSTGSADVAAAAGAECVEIGHDSMAVQGTGLPPKTPGMSYTNTDYTFVDDTDVDGTTAAYVVAREKYSTAFDVGQLIDTRERRQIVGEHTITPMDIFNGRTLPDTVVLARSNFDTHGYTVHPLFALKPPDRESLDAYIPLRALLPKGIGGVLVTGLAVSADRDAMPVIRMQPDIQNQGYAAGYIAAMASKQKTPILELDMREIQRHMVDSHILEPEVLTHTDSYPLDDSVLASAAENVADDYTGISVLLSDPERSVPLVKEAYHRARGEGKVVYAHILAMTGDDTGAETLLETVLAREWDEGWNYKGMGQFGMNMSRLDSYIVALGLIGGQKALPAVIEKAEQLTTDAAFSHFRAIALACEAIGSPAASPALAKLLNLPGLRGHYHPDMATALNEVSESSTDDDTRNRALKEIVLARALYRCGDLEDLGKGILEEYSRDMRGGFAVHAQAVLSA